VLEDRVPLQLIADQQRLNVRIRRSHGRSGSGARTSRRAFLKVRLHEMLPAPLDTISGRRMDVIILSFV
jgi:hypothetical protein